MKLLVQEKLTTAIYEDPGSTPQDYKDDEEFWKFITSLLDGFAVHYNLEHKLGYWLFEIPEQKITLDEQDMNELFYECFNVLLDYRVEYSALGGKGCGFSVCMYKKEIK